MAYASNTPSSFAMVRAACASVASVLKRASDRLIESRQRQAATIVRQAQADLDRSDLDRSGLDRAHLSQDAERYRYYF